MQMSGSPGSAIVAVRFTLRQWAGPCELSVIVGQRRAGLLPIIKDLNSLIQPKSGSSSMVICCKTTSILSFNVSSTLLIAYIRE